MKKWIAGMALLCLCLTACGNGSQTPATTAGAQLNATTTTKNSTRATSFTTTPTAPTTGSTVPTTASTTSRKPATYPTTTSTTAPIYSDPKCYFTGQHEYENGVCIHCKKPSPSTVPSTTTSPKDMCQQGVHEYNDGCCIHCFNIEPRDVDGTLIVNNKDITAGNYVKLNPGYSNTSLPLTAILTELGIEWEWESDAIFRFGTGENEKTLDLNCLHFGWTIPPGRRGCVREVIDGEIIIDGNSLRIDYLSKIDILFRTDYEKKVIQIGTKTPTYITDPITPQGEGYPFKEEPGPYVMKEVNGVFYIDFGEGNRQVSITSGCVTPAITFYRDSAEDLYNTLMTGDFTMKELQVIRASFQLEAGLGFRLPNPKELYDIQVPEGVSSQIMVKSNGFSFVWDKGEPSRDEEIAGNYIILTRKEFESGLAFYSEIKVAEGETIIETPLPEQNAVRYEVHDNLGRVLYYVKYSYHSGNNVMHVIECNSPWISTGGVVNNEGRRTSSIYVFGCVNGEYYRMHVTCRPDTPPAEWFYQFQKVPLNLA